MSVSLTDNLQNVFFIVSVIAAVFFALRFPEIACQSNSVGGTDVLFFLWMQSEFLELVFFSLSRQLWRPYVLVFTTPRGVVLTFNLLTKMLCFLKS